MFVLLHIISQAAAVTLGGGFIPWRTLILLHNHSRPSCVGSVSHQTPYQRRTSVISVRANHQSQMGLSIPHCACYWVVNFILRWAVEGLCFSGLTSCPTLNPMPRYAKVWMENTFLREILPSRPPLRKITTPKRKQCTQREICLFSLCSSRNPKQLRWGRFIDSSEVSEIQY